MSHIDSPPLLLYLPVFTVDFFGFFRVDFCFLAPDFCSRFLFFADDFLFDNFRFGDFRFSDFCFGDFRFDDFRFVCLVCVDLSAAGFGFDVDVETRFGADSSPAVGERGLFCDPLIGNVLMNIIFLIVRIERIFHPFSLAWLNCRIRNLQWKKNCQYDLKNSYGYYSRYLCSVGSLKKNRCKNK